MDMKKKEFLLRRYLGGHVLRNAMITFERTMSPLVKQKMKASFPNTPAIDQEIEDYQANQSKLDEINDDIAALKGKLKDVCSVCT
jgi:hypothetical protein